MYKFGLKLWSINKNYVAEAQRLYQQGIYHYIELYVKPGSYDKYIQLWQKLAIPFIVHAPHFMDKMNLAKKEQAATNKILFAEAKQYADSLKARYIIIHPGIDGDIEETAKQLKAFGDKRLLVENKPYYALGNNLICNGTTPEEIELVMKQAGTGFCLDIGHAFCAANGHKQNHLDYLKRLLALKPQLFHFADGQADNLCDKHEHIGDGNFNLKAILELLPPDALMTIETMKDSQGNLDDFVRDVKKVRQLSG